MDGNLANSFWHLTGRAPKSQKELRKNVSLCSRERQVGQRKRERTIGPDRLGSETGKNCDANVTESFAELQLERHVLLV